MAPRIRSVGSLVRGGFALLLASGSGCASPFDVGVHESNLDADVTSLDHLSCGDVDELAREMWAPDCAKAAVAARATAHEVRLALQGPYVFVEIDGLLACAVSASSMPPEQMRLISSSPLRRPDPEPASPDESRPDPEPASPDESRPDPEPAGTDGRPDPEPASPGAGG